MSNQYISSELAKTMFVMLKNPNGTAGELIHGYYSEPISFTDFGDMLLKMESIFDALCMPQASFQKRSIAKDTNIKSPEHIRLNPPKETHSLQDLYLKNVGLLAFVIRVIYRQNATWQGELIMKGYPKICFRSALELIYVLNQAIELGAFKCSLVDCDK